jgi:serine/threonine-protein kinase
MSPEQVRGRVVDRRADIWAFGCVMYELLTGTRAFEGDTVSDTLAAVLKSEPDWSRLPAATPTQVRELLQHCLQRDARLRLRDIGDARLLVQPASLQATVTPATPHRRRWLDVWLGAASAAALLAAVWFVARSPSPPSVAGAVRRVTVPLPDMLPGSTSGGGPLITMSMDGSAIGFTGLSGGQRQLVVHRLADASTTLLRGTAGAGTPVLSPDGRWVAFIRGDTAWRVAVDGGDPEKLCVLRGSPRGGTWGPDGRLLFATTEGLNEVTANGGDCEVSLPAREPRFGWPQILPLKRGVLLTVSSVSDDADSAAIVAIPAGTTERREVIRGARGGRVTASGHLVFVRGSTIFAAPFDLDRLAITANPVAVVEGVASGVASGPLLEVSAGETSSTLRVGPRTASWSGSRGTAPARIRERLFEATSRSFVSPPKGAGSPSVSAPRITICGCMSSTPAR